MLCLRPRWPWFVAMATPLLLSARAAAAPRTAPPTGLRENTPSTHALVDARLVVAPGKVIEHGALVIREGVIVAAGADVEIPPEARRWDCRGKTIYPGFIDAMGELSAEASKLGVSEKHGAGYWNPKVMPQIDAAARYSSDADANKRFRSQGFTARLIAPSAGIIKGVSALVSMNDDSGGNTILAPRVALHLMLTPSRGDDLYPKSPMGAVALVRQAFYDARWCAAAWQAYEKQPGLPRPERNDALVALQDASSGKMPIVVRTLDELYCLRADRLAKEFELNVILEGSGHEYRRVEAIKATELPVIVPLDFPKPPNVSTPEAAMSVSLEELMHWDLAPENPGRLAAAGIKIALTSHGLKETGDFLAAVRKAVDRGLSPEAALAALTVTPAELFGVADRLGTLEAGKMASFIITNGDLFDPGAKLIETWVDGRRHELAHAPLADLRGTWEAKLSKPDGGAETLMFELAGEPEKLSGKIKRGDREATLTRAALDGAQFAARFDAKSLGWQGVLQISGTVSMPPDRSTDEEVRPSWLGFLIWSSGERSACSARRTKPFESQAAQSHPPSDAGNGDAGDEKSSKSALYPVNFPLGAFGVSSPPEQPKAVLFQHATIWTCSPAGVIEDASVLVREGKIAAVGANVDVPADVVLIDAKDKHLTPGIIDCHTHIATDGGINEMSQSITAEVRIGDFIDPNDVHIYRQLAGGVTTANVLHGSANTIGGQNQVIKLRWGALPEELKFTGAPPGIKFALGENVKQNHWGPGTRYPQSRMGVEQVVTDAFNAAIDYRRRWNEWREEQTGLPPRTDLELEALVEVLEGKRHVHCHSYRQDEILAFLRTCQNFGVRVRTLQHVLEGYKVADAIARHGAGASSFSDWWGYKFEVYDAIPYNGAMLHQAGVLTSFNSDDPELARRLNLEAAKAVKYGGVPPEEALKFVTINPAKQLGVDAHVGSLEAGKDADLVVWNSSPLSSYARCEQTWIDGRKYFDRQTDIERRRETAGMRAALIQRVLASGEPTEGLDERKKESWPRDDIVCHDHDDDGEIR